MHLATSVAVGVEAEGPARSYQDRWKAQDPPGEESRLMSRRPGSGVDPHGADPLIGVPDASGRKGLARQPAPTQVLGDPIVVVRVDLAKALPYPLWAHRELDLVGERDHA